MTDDTVLHKLTCKRCGYSWYPKKPEKPQQCPKCHNCYWDKDRVYPIKMKEISNEPI